MRIFTPFSYFLFGLALCCLPQLSRAQCDPGFTFANACLGGGLTDFPALTICPADGANTVEANILQYVFVAGSLRVYAGGTGTDGTLVWDDPDGNSFVGVAPPMVSTATGGDCLYFIVTAPAGQPSCDNTGGALPELQICHREVSGVTAGLTLAVDELCANDAPIMLAGGTPAGGVYSGSGVTESGGVYSFNPAAVTPGIIPITYTVGGSMAMDDMLVDALGGVSLVIETPGGSDVSSRCIDEGTIILTNGLPAGGTYSGDGVTDNLDGTFTFNPALALGGSTGTATITYTESGPCGESATDVIEVTDACTCPAPQTSFFHCQVNNEMGEAEGPIFQVCPSSGSFAVQATITAGTYSVVLDDGDHLDVYSAVENSGSLASPVATDIKGNLAGLTINGTVAGECLVFYSTTGNVGSCNDLTFPETALEVCGADIAPSVGFVNPGDFCSSDAPVTLTGGSPAGGVYSGPGVTESGGTYTFDPGAVTPGSVTLTYMFGAESATATFEVFASGSVTLSPFADICIDADPLVLTGGSPAGGSYSGDGVSLNVIPEPDEYEFDPIVAGLGMHTITYTENGGCNESASQQINVTAPCTPCDNGGTSYFYCSENFDNAVQAFTICPTDPTMSVQADIIQGSFGTYVPDPDHLTVYAGDVGDNNIVFGPMSGDLAGMSITGGDCPGECLTFVVSMGPVGSCGDGNEAPLIVCAIDVASVDAIPPTAVCNDFTVNLDGSGNASVSSSQLAGSSTDNCSGDLSYVPTSFSFTCADVGSNTVTVQVFDASMNSASCMSDVTVLDGMAPDAVCQDITVQLTAGGIASITSSDIDGGSTDNCGVASLSATPSTFTCPQEGANVAVTLTVADVNGNSSTCTAQVHVDDQIPPMAVCQDITVQLDASGNVSISPNDVNGGSTDNCGFANALSVMPSSFTCSNTGSNTVTMRVGDGNGNQSTCTANVTVEDSMAPNAICQDVTVELDANGQGSLTPNDIDNGSTDNCGIVLKTINGSSGVGFFCDNVGLNHMVQLAVFDASGNSHSCTAAVDVQDNISPTISCPADETLMLPPGNCSIEYTVAQATADDNCGVEVLRYRYRRVDENGNNIAGENWSGWTTAATQTLTSGFWKIQWQAKDPSNNQRKCSFIVTVPDDEDPVAICPTSFAVENDAGQCGAAVTFGIDVSDNCPGATVESSPASGDFFPVGTTTVNVTATDAVGNTDQCSFEVKVNDTEDPSAICPAPVVMDNDPGLCSAVVEFGIDVSDNCPGATVEADLPSGSVFDVGTTTVTLMATDAAGNTDACSFDVTIIDAEDPVIACGGLNLTVPNDPGLCEADVELPVPGYTDNCGVVTVEFRYREVDENNNPLGPWTSWMDESEASGTFAVGRYRIRWRIFDEAGNSDACTRFLTVEDVEPPIITCTNHDVVFNGEEYIDLYVPDIATATDNCEVASVELDINRIFCDELGDQITVTATATDVNGLTSVCTSKVDVLGLPCGWSQDPDGVGCEDGNAVSYSVPLDEFTVESTDCHNAVTTGSDEYAFGQYTLCGDGMITAQVTSITGTFGGWAGVTMRGSNDADDQMVSLMTNLSNQHRTEMRLTAGGSVTSSLSPSFNRHWLRIQRIGNNFRGFVSFNGLSWFTKFNIYVPMDQCIEIGLIVNSSSASGDNSATFANVAVVGDPVFDTPPLVPLQQWESSQPEFSLYPNPTSGRVTVQLGDFLDQEGELVVMDVNGQQLRSVRKGLLEYATEEVDLTDLPAGIYFLQLRLEDGTMQTQRVILQPRP